MDSKNIFRFIFKDRYNILIAQSGVIFNNSGTMGIRGPGFSKDPVE